MSTLTELLRLLSGYGLSRNKKNDSEYVCKQNNQQVNGTMENLRIKGSKDLFFIPDVDFNAQTGICNIEGESYLENTAKFYKPLIEWLENYIKLGKPLVFNSHLVYFNTGSSKYIVQLLSIIKEYQDEGGEATVNWYYDKYHLEMIEEIEDFMIETDLKINMISFN